MLRSKYFIAFTLLLTLIFSGCAEKSSDKKAYKVGVILPLSGEAAEIGNELKKILDYHLEETEKKSQADYTFELVYEDGKCSKDRAHAAFQKLSAMNDLHFIIGGVCGTESLAITPFLEEKGIVAISPLTSDPQLEGKSNHFFSLSYTDTLMEEALIQELGHFKKVAFLSEKNIFNQKIAEIIKEKLKEDFPETEIVVFEEFEDTKTDFSVVLGKIKNSGAEIVFLNTTPGVSAENLLQKITEDKDWNLKLISHNSYNNQEMLKKFPQVTEGMIIIDVPEITSPSFVEIRNKITTFNGSLDNLNSYYIASTLDSFDLLYKLVGQYQGDTQKIQQALAQENFAGYLGTIHFGGKTFVQSPQVSKFLVKNGELIKQ